MAQFELLIKISGALAEEWLQEQKNVTVLSRTGHSGVVRVNISTTRNGGLVCVAKELI
jgi:hypothetical protein